MALLGILSSLDGPSWAALVFAAVVLVHVVPYILDPHGFRSYPGPFLAKLSDFWLGKVAADGHRSERVHELHEIYGKYPLSSSARPGAPVITASASLKTVAPA